MKTLSELNEELYEKVGRLHTYEGFLSEAQAKQVAENIFKEYKSAVEEYFEETKLRREKRLFELNALNRALTPKRTFFGLFANKTAKEAERQIKPIAEAYRAEYALDDVLFDAMREDEPAVDDGAEEDVEEDVEEKHDTAGTLENGAKNGAENAVADNDGDKSTPAEKEAETPAENDEEEDDEEIIEDDEEDVADPFVGQMEMEL